MRTTLLLLGWVLVPVIALAAADTGRVHTPMADITVSTSATLIDPLNTNRTALSCTNNDDTIHVRWGSSAVTPTTGQRIPANSTIEIKGTDAIYMAAETGSVTVSCTKETTQ